MPNNRPILPDWARHPHRFVGQAIPAQPTTVVTKGKTGEELFNLILSGIKEIYDLDDVYIAGGAVRDVAAGVSSHSDVDVFLPITLKDFIGKFPELGWSGGLAEQPFHDYSTTKRQGDFRFKATGRALSIVKGIKVDLVFIEKPLTKANVDSFPIYAQRGVWSLDKQLDLSPEAKADIEGKTFTIDPTITDKKVLIRLAEKVATWQKGAYKGWKLVEPETKEWWEAVKESEEASKKIKQTKTKVKEAAEELDRFRALWRDVQGEVMQQPVARDRNGLWEIRVE